MNGFDIGISILQALRFALGKAFCQNSMHLARVELSAEYPKTKKWLGDKYHGS